MLLSRLFRWIACGPTPERHRGRASQVLRNLEVANARLQQAGFGNGKNLEALRRELERMGDE